MHFKWLYAMYLVVTARKGISSMQLAKEIGVTQKSAWFMLQGLREACGKNIDKLRGQIEGNEMTEREEKLKHLLEDLKPWAERTAPKLLCERIDFWLGDLRNDPSAVVVLPKDDLQAILIKGSTYDPND